MKQQMKALFDQVTMSEECEMRIEKMLRENGKKKNFGVKRKAVLAAVAAAVLCALPITAYAATGGEILRFLGGKGTIYHGSAENGSVIAKVEMETSPENDLFRQENGKLYLMGSGGEIDLTDQLSETEPYIYSCAAADGTVHYLIIGGSAENYGYAEFVKDANGVWQGGYSYNAVGEWYKQGARELELPWAGMIESAVDGADDENAAVSPASEEWTSIDSEG